MQIPPVYLLYSVVQLYVRQSARVSIAPTTVSPPAGVRLEHVLVSPRTPPGFVFRFPPLLSWCLLTDDQTVDVACPQNSVFVLTICNKGII